VRNFQIAIDGPAASGKSTTARRVAAELNIQYLDTGAMYRAFTVALLDAGVEPKDDASVASKIQNISFRQTGDHFYLGSRDISHDIRSNKISSIMAPVCANPAVRSHLVTLQREMGQAHSCVVDGRDIGTVVFPDAQFKFFLVADLRERALRRQRDLCQRGDEIPLETLIEDIRQRDLSDSTRAVGPLLKAADAVEIDTTRLDFDEQVQLIVNHVRQGLT
jgi:CMP/dCMP kinase